MSASQAIIRTERARIHSVESHEGGVRVIGDSGTRDYPGCYVHPGFVDAHAHVIGLGMKLGGLSLYDAQSSAECVRRALESGPNRGDWIVGMGWNQELWSPSLMPDREELDRSIANVPVCLRRADGHALWLNSEALRRAGIDELLSEPPGAKFLRRANGELSGVLVDNAIELVQQVLPEYSNEQYAEFIRTALKACSAQGITEVHDMDVAPHHLAIYRELAEKGELHCRLQSYVKGQHQEWLREGVLPAVGEFQRTLGVKFYADGALGSRGAALLEDYADDPNNRGLMLITEEHLFESCRLAIDQGFHIATHAIGDAANRMVLNAYERLRRGGIADEHTILRIEHAQIVCQEDRARFAQANVVASVQPVHCISDAVMADKRLFDRCDRSYPWKSLLDEGVLLCAGSDFPIESHSVLQGIDAFCRRVPFNSSQSWYSRECINREQALRAYTIDAHRAADMHYRRGVLQSGFDADFVIVDRDLYHCAPEDILQTKIIATYCGGKLRYEA